MYMFCSSESILELSITVSDLFEHEKSPKSKMNIIKELTFMDAKSISCF